MSNNITIVPFSEKYSDRWDRFVMEQSCNGTFLQTRNFLNYHPEGRFTDSSLLFLKGSEIVAVLPANILMEEGQKKVFSHRGSTFGGIIIGKNNIKVSVLKIILEELDQYCADNNIKEIRLKMTSMLYSKESSELIDYMLFNYGYMCSMEVGYYVDFSKYNDDMISNYSPSVRKHYKNSLSHNLEFRELNDRDDIAAFYDVLLDNYKKFGTQPVHTLDELLMLKETTLREKIMFFGVFHGEDAVASSMVFDFANKVFHTQYLASRSSYSSLYVNEFLYTNLIREAKDRQYPFLSFGTATLNAGKLLNYNLAQYKEQYGTDQYVNRTYRKVF